MAKLTSTDIYGSLYVQGAQTGSTLTLTQTTGTAPMTISSTTLVDNLNVEFLNGQLGAYYLNWTNVTNKPDPVITLGGDLSGSVTLTDLASGTLTATIVADSVALGTDTTGNYVATIAPITSSGLTINNSGTETAAVTLGHSNIITAGTASGSTGAIAFGGTVNIPSITYDVNGHVVTKTTTSITLPSPSYTTNTDTLVSQAISTATTLHPLLASIVQTSDITGPDVTTAIRNNLIYVQPSTGTIYGTNAVFTGDLQVTGTTTTNNVTTVSTANGVIFEGTVADDFELELLAGVLTADRTVTLPNLTGTVALTSDARFTDERTDSTKLPLAGGVIDQDGRITFAANSGNGGILSVGGNGSYTPGSLTSSIASTNGNLHIDAGTSSSLILNLYSGTGGVKFGDGNTGYVAAIGNTGIVTALGGTSTEWNTGYDYSQVGHLPLTGGTLSNDLHVTGDIWIENSGDDAWRWRAGMELANQYGFADQYGNAQLMINEQGTTNQAMILGDTSTTNAGTLFGISINNGGAESPSTGAEAGWNKVFEVTGTGIGYLAGNEILTDDNFISGTDYEVPLTFGTGLTRAVNTINHTNSVTAGTINGSSGAIAFGGTINIPSVTYDAQGHITSTTSTSITLPTEVAPNDGILTMSVSGLGLSGSDTFSANQSSATTFTVTSNATVAATPSTTVYRDATGNATIEDELIATDFSMKYDSTSKSVKFIFA